MTRRLTPEQKRFLVLQAAEMAAPYDTAEEFLTAFGFEITPQLTECYNPTKRNGRDLSQPLRDLFEMHREAFFKDTSSVPITHKRYRLQVLDNLLDKATKEDDRKTVFRALELAAKETGGYVIRQESDTAGVAPPIRESTAEESAEAAAFFEHVDATGDYSLTLEQYRFHAAEKGKL